MRSSRYDGKDLDFSRPIIDSMGYEQDYITGLWYPVELMIQIAGNWYHRDNVDSDLLDRVRDS